MKKILSIFVFVILFSSCSEYEKALKSEDVAVKYNAATKQYDAGKYMKALRILEEIAPSYKGKPSAEKLFYMLSQSYYKTKQYNSAAYQFNSFASSYPKSINSQEAAFMSAKSYYMLSPRYSLDQTDTDKAIDKMQNFIDMYPNSSYLGEANAVIKELRYKLEKKAFEVAKQYNTIGSVNGDYKSAIIAFDNFISDYPGTPFKEDALFYKLDSAYNLAINSVPSKMQQRLDDAKSAYSSLIKFNAETKYKKEAGIMLAKIEKDLKQYSK